MTMKKKNSIIDINPRTRSKGFLANNINLSAYKSEDIIYVWKKINNISNNIDSYDLPNEDKKIINLFFESYKARVVEKKILKKELILKNHENIEIRKISDDNLIRYFIYRYKFNINKTQKILDDYPPCIQIEPTSFCNYRCIMCYQDDRTFSNKSHGYMGHMKLDLFKKIIDELEGKIEAITLASRGEPTLNPNFKEFIKYFDNKFLAVKLNTNASMLNESLIHTLLSSNIQTIVFSIDAATKEIYEKIRVNGKLEIVLKNLELFNEIRMKYYSNDKHIVRISGVRISKNQDIKEMEDKWKNFADIIAFTNYIPWESSYENEINNIIEPCTEFWSRMFIWYDGKVNPCDFDYKSKLSKWNVKEDSIKNIWNSDEYNHLRNFHLNNLRSELEPCRRCINV